MSVTKPEARSTLLPKSMATLPAPVSTSRVPPVAKSTTGTLVPAGSDESLAVFTSTVSEPDSDSSGSSPTSAAEPVAFSAV